MPSVAASFGNTKKYCARKKSRIAPSGNSSPIVHANALREILTPSPGRNQNAITSDGTINSSRLTVYPCGDASAGISVRNALVLIVCSVKPAGTITIASMAIVIQNAVVAFLMWLAIGSRNAESLCLDPGRERSTNRRNHAMKFATPAFAAYFSVDGRLNNSPTSIVSRSMCSESPLASAFVSLVPLPWAAM